MELRNTEHEHDRTGRCEDVTSISLCLTYAGALLPTSRVLFILCTNDTEIYTREKLDDTHSNYDRKLKALQPTLYPFLPLANPQTLLRLRPSNVQHLYNHLRTALAHPGPNTCTSINFSYFQVQPLFTSVIIQTSIIQSTIITNPPFQRNSSTNIGAIVGGVVGGVVGLAILTLITILLIRRHRRNRENTSSMETSTPHTSFPPHLASLSLTTATTAWADVWEQASVASLCRSNTCRSTKGGRR
ncbi:hypothetical protein E4T56_gene3576 [Termitomyces sp. T112]|nr:hypothetical protein E4T56_gene3576 [Termitomyces sp. T112]